jgi:hypothetical protein
VCHRFRPVRSAPVLASAVPRWSPARAIVPTALGIAGASLEEIRRRRAGPRRPDREKASMGSIRLRSFPPERATRLRSDRTQVSRARRSRLASELLLPPRIVEQSNDGCDPCGGLEQKPRHGVSDAVLTFVRCGKLSICGARFSESRSNTSSTAPDCVLCLDRCPKQFV